VKLWWEALQRLQELNHLCHDLILGPSDPAD
jgi:hypothetical protein